MKEDDLILLFDISEDLSVRCSVDRRCRSSLILTEENKNNSRGSVMRKSLTDIIYGLVILAGFYVLVIPANAQEKIGIRPYELTWANRNDDDTPAFLDFEKEMSWLVSTEGCQASFTRSREEQIWGKYVARLACHAENSGTKIVIQPVNPIPMPKNDFDAASFWIYGNQWGWMSGPKIVIPLVELLFKMPNGSEKSIMFCRVNWKQWNKVYYRFSKEELAELRQPGVCFNGFRIYNTKNTDERVLYFDNLSFYKEEFKPLSFAPRPKRGIEMFPGQPTGVHTGKGRLPFPNREETILPDCAARGSTVEMSKKNDEFHWRYKETDGELTISYRPVSGSWSDLTASWKGGKKFKPADHGGITALAGKNDEIEPVISAHLLTVKQEGKTALVQWRFKSASSEAIGEYRLQMMGKSIVLDVIARGGKVAKIDFGGLSSVQSCKQIAVPYYTYVYGGVNRPFLLAFVPEEGDQSLFMMTHPDWYRSNATSLQGVRNADLLTGSNQGFKKANGEIGYEPKLDGKRNDVYERIFIAISPMFEETLPTIANPASPYKSMVGTRIWYSRGASSNRQNDIDYWARCHRGGLYRMLVTDHEVGWRNEGESFTFRTKPDPLKGGDDGQNKFARFMIDKLGYVYGPYNNFMDFAPINEFWDPDLVIRTADNQLQKGWPRCYGPKAARAVEYSEKLVPEIQKKFRFNAGYCDVHTAVPPWARVDYDSRVPGAGTFAANYYSWGELFLAQKKDWNGPVFSEGPLHFLYSGLTDGNYAQDQGYRFVENPWLVDFDLLKIHDLECNYGMGKIYMFEPKIRQAGKVIQKEEQNYYLDRYLAAVLAFGHTGYYVPDFGPKGGNRSYFMIQAIAARYTQSPVSSIRYAGPNGELMTASQAIASDLYKRSQLVIEYKDGTVVVVNGNNTEPMLARNRFGKIARISPNGYMAWTKSGDIFIESLNRFGFRFDYADTPEYLYFDGRGYWQTREKACGNGQGYCLIRKDHQYELFMLDGQTGFALDCDKATALDFERKPIGEAKIKRSRGYLFVEPVPNAISYLLENTAPNFSKQTGSLSADHSSSAVGTSVGGSTQDSVSNEPLLNGESGKLPLTNVPIAVLPGTKLELPDVTIPRWCGPGTVYWDKKSGLFFQIARFSLVRADLRDQNLLSVKAVNIMSPEQPVKITVNLNGQFLKKESEQKLQNDFYEIENTFRLPAPTKSGEDKLEVMISANGRFEFWQYSLTTTQGYRPWNVVLVPNTAKSDEVIVPQTWIKTRNGPSVQNFENTGAVTAFTRNMMTDSIGKDGYFMHPPYRRGTGAVWLEYEFFVPFFDGFGTAFRCEVGKKDRSTPGDGFLCQIKVLTDQGKEVLLTELHVADYKWHDLEADLSPWRGKKIKLRLICDVGPNNNSVADQSQWANLRIESLNKVFSRRLSEDPITYRLE